MKNIVKYIFAAIILLPIAGCNPYNTWPEGLPELEHVYYVSNVKTGNGTEQDLQHEIAADGTARFLKRIHYNPAPPAGTPLTQWVYSPEKNVTMPMDIRFISERIRTYDVTTYFWIENPIGSLAAGTDYAVLSSSGATMTPNAEGGYSLIWPKAEKGQQSIKVKRLSSKTGQLRVMFLYRPRVKITATSADGFDTPNRDDLEVTLLNNKTNDYTVRGFWHDYRYPVTVKFQ